MPPPADPISQSRFGCRCAAYAKAGGSLHVSDWPGTYSTAHGVHYGIEVGAAILLAKDPPCFLFHSSSSFCAAHSGATNRTAFFTSFLSIASWCL